MPQSLSDLKKEAQLLGLQVFQSGKRPAKEDYFSVLREHYFRRDFPSGLAYDELSPMLCFDYWNLKSKEQKAIWKDHNWIAQEKLNGCRLILHFVKGVGVFAHSRTVSAHTYRRVELTDHLLFGSFSPDFTAVVDAEVVADKKNLQSTTSLIHMAADDSKRLQQGTPLRAHVFDIVNWQGTDLRLRKLCERLAFIKDFQEAVSLAQLSKYFDFPPIFFQGKRAVFDKILANGGEGVVLKNLNYHYEDSNSRSRYGWVKVKKQIELDAYVSGYERGKPGSEYENHVSCLIFSVNTKEGHRAIAKVSNLPWFYRKEISIHDRVTNSVKLRMDEYGRVAHVTGLELSQRAFRLVHPRIVYWRSDLKQDQCTYSIADLQAARIGVTGASTLKVLNRTEEKSG